jgi:hypothetical protein
MRRIARRFDHHARLIDPGRQNPVGDQGGVRRLHAVEDIRKEIF